MSGNGCCESVCCPSTCTVQDRGARKGDRVVLIFELVAFSDQIRFVLYLILYSTCECYILLMCYRRLHKMYLAGNRKPL